MVRMKIKESSDGCFLFRLCAAHLFFTCLSLSGRHAAPSPSPENRPTSPSDGFYPLRADVDAYQRTTTPESRNNNREKIKILNIGDKKASVVFRMNPHITCGMGLRRRRQIFDRDGRPDITIAELGGRTPLSRAVEYGNCTIARLLLAHGPDVNAKSYNGRRTRLIEVAEARHKARVRL